MLNKTVCIGMSGGVDSAVSAYLLKQQGFNVIGIYINTSDTHAISDNICSAMDDIHTVASVCTQLRIPYYNIDMHDEYIHSVLSPMIEEMKMGFTPNPDIWCNEFIKFSVFFNTAMNLGADMIATGHYAQINYDPIHLLQAVDHTKDQSYFLYRLSKNILRQTIFPIGHMYKYEVRALAQKIGLSNASRKDSTGVCLLHSYNKFKDFVLSKLGETSGPIIDDYGMTIGTHMGLHFFTIGQRKGIRIGGAHNPFFVTGKNVQTNSLFVTKSADSELLYSRYIFAKEIYWINGAPNSNREYSARIRHLGDMYRCRFIHIGAHSVYIMLYRTIPIATPGQSLVIYDNNICMGGGIIHKASMNYSNTD